MSDNLPPTLVSVCLITYNHKDYIRQALEGILGQTVSFQWELIVADDCSVDGTRDILLEYKEKYPKLIRLILQEKNVGGGNNFAMLMGSATGKYIAYLEGDDYWTYPLKLQMQVDFLESNANYGLVCTDADFFNQQSSRYITRSLYHKKSGEITFNKLLHKNTIISFTVVLRREVYERIKFINDISRDKGWKMGDYPLWLELVQHSKIHYIHLKSGVYRVLPNSVTSRMDKHKYHVFEKSALDVRHYFISKYKKGDEDLLRDAQLEYKFSLLKYAIICKDIIGIVTKAFGLFQFGFSPLYRKYF